MKLKTLAIFSLAVFTIAGCSSESTSEKKESLKVEAVEVKEKDYPDKIDELNTSLDEGFRNLNSIAEEDPGAKDREKRLIEQVDAIEKAVNGYKAIIAPEKYNEVHDQYLAAMKHYDEGIDTMREAIEKNDSELWMKGNEPIKQGFDLWIEAHSKLADSVPIGDGTITAADLKQLDALAGIDRDSVKENISKDGKELVGKWGAAGSPPSIVLNADGSYEGYANDTYPSKDHMSKGTWKYDEEKGAIFFTHEEAYSDGKPSTDFRKSMIMGIQSFKDGNLRLLDVESYNEFLYEKME
jgi:archaellum component FlaC